MWTTHSAEVSASGPSSAGQLRAPSLPKKVCRRIPECEQGNWAYLFVCVAARNASGGKLVPPGPVQNAHHGRWMQTVAIEFPPLVQVLLCLPSRFAVIALWVAIVTSIFLGAAIFRKIIPLHKLYKLNRVYSSAMLAGCGGS